MVVKISRGILPGDFLGNRQDFSRGHPFPWKISRILGIMPPGWDASRVDSGRGAGANYFSLDVFHTKDPKRGTNPPR